MISSVTIEGDSFSFVLTKRGRREIKSASRLCGISEAQFMHDAVREFLQRYPTIEAIEAQIAAVRAKRA